MSQVSIVALARLQMFSAFRHGGYRLFWLGGVISLVGGSIWLTAQGWLVLELTDSAFLLGLVGFCTTIPQLTFFLLGGIVADMVDRRLLLIAVHIGFAALIFLLAALASGGVVNVWQVAVIALLGGTLRAFFLPTRQAIVPDLVSRDDIMNAVAFNSSGFFLGNIGGSAAAGVLVRLITLAGCFYVGGVTFVAAALAFFAMEVVARPAPPKQRAIWGSFVEGFSYVRSNQILLGLVLVRVIPALLESHLWLMPIFARDILGVGAPGLGFLMAALSAGSLLGALGLAFLGNFRRKGWLLLSTFFLSGPVLILFASSRSYALSLALLVGVGATMQAYATMTTALVQIIVPDELRGRVMSIFLFTGQGLVPIASLQGGIVASHFGAPFAVGLSGAMVTCFGLAAFFFMPQVRKLE